MDLNTLSIHFDLIKQLNSVLKCLRIENVLKIDSLVLNRLVLFNVLDVETKPPSYYSRERGDRLLHPLVSRYK